MCDHREKTFVAIRGSNAKIFATFVHIRFPIIRPQVLSVPLSSRVES